METISNRLTKGIICFAVIFGVGFSGIAGHDLWTPDEPRVAAVTLEMAETGNFVVPQLAGRPFIEKPPLYFAAAALMLKGLGPVIGNTAAIRMTTVFFGLGVLLMTFLITRRLRDTETGILAVIVLATMEGFVENFHWIRVDAALTFFILAAVWCFVETLLAKRNKLLPLSGFFAAGAFLSKGLIGPVLVAVPWLGLAAVWCFSDRGCHNEFKPILKGHLWAFAVFCLLSGFWMALLYIKGGPELWNEWFWVNHIGRFTGTASKGHIKEGEPFYYVLQLIAYGMPWTPVLLAGIGVPIVRFMKTRKVTNEFIFLLIWGAGSIILLTLPATKRGIYLLPVLPAFAVMSAIYLKETVPGWFDRYTSFWSIVCVTLIVLILIIPLMAGILPEEIPASIRFVLADYNHYHGITILCMLITLTVFRFQKSLSTGYAMAAVTACLYVSLLGVPIQAIDREKSMAQDIRNFVSGIAETDRARIAGFDFSETMQGNFYYYTGWRIPQIESKSRMQAVLAGTDEDYDSLILNQRGHLDEKPDPVSYPHRIIAKTVTGGDRLLFWIKGEDRNMPDELFSEQQNYINEGLQ